MDALPAAPHPLIKPIDHGFCRRLMKRWCGWGERLTNLISPEFRGSGEGHALRGGGSRRTIKGALRRLVEKLVLRSVI
jgi:hypothetical protein